MLRCRDHLVADEPKCHTPLGNALVIGIRAQDDLHGFDEDIDH